MAKKASSTLAAQIAGRVLRGGRYNEADVLALAASVLAQREKGAAVLAAKKRAGR